MYLPKIVRDPRIMIEAGTPFIKREGMAGVRAWRVGAGHHRGGHEGERWRVDEVWMAAQAGARAITVLGSSPVETLRLSSNLQADGHDQHDRYAGR